MVSGVLCMLSNIGWVGRSVGRSVRPRDKRLNKDSEDGGGPLK